MITGQPGFSEADKLYSNAMRLRSAGDIAGAATLLKEVTLRFNQYGKAWCELGNLLQYELNDLEAAETCYIKATEVTPAHPQTYLGYADLLFAQEKFAEANAILNQAMEIQGVRKDLVIYKNALLIESQGRYDEAIAAYKEAILATFDDEEIIRCEKGISRCNIKKKYR